ncbi:DUF4432 family protein [Agrobacterium tumefaciens]|nr:DUF4432 family protein [Agrobacterium tumefaciens]
MTIGSPHADDPRGRIQCEGEVVHVVVQKGSDLSAELLSVYHVNFGYPFLDEQTKLSGDLDASFVAAFNAEDKQPRDDSVDYFQEVAIASETATASIALTNAVLMDGIEVKLRFSPAALPDFGVWQAFQSGVYTLALEPMRRGNVNNEVNEWPGMLSPGQVASSWLELQLSSIDRI